jgi:RNA polymerase sigma-70 factor (ECF subfamily)
MHGTHIEMASQSPVAKLQVADDGHPVLTQEGVGVWFGSQFSVHLRRRRRATAAPSQSSVETASFSSDERWKRSTAEVSRLPACRFLPSSRGLRNASVQPVTRAGRQGDFSDTFGPRRRSCAVHLAMATSIPPPPIGLDERRALSGDRAAWDALIARHDRRVVVSLLARGLPIDRAKEIAHETWIALFERQQRGELGELKLPGLAIAQAGFLALDEHRRAGRADARRAEASAAEVVADPSSVETRLLDRERLSRAQAALRSLGAGAQRVFGLLYEEERLTHREAAARLGLSEQRVRQTLCEVRGRLRAALEEEP